MITNKEGNTVKITKWFLAFTLLVCSIAGCSVIEDLGQTAADNQLVVDIAVRQAVFRYIDAGDTKAEQDAGSSSC